MLEDVECVCQVLKFCSLAHASIMRKVLTEYIINVHMQLIDWYKNDIISDLKILLGLHVSV